MLLPQPIVFREIILHVRQVHGHIHDLVPRRPGILQDPLHVLENTAHLRCNVVRNDVAIRIQLNPWDLLGAAFPWAHTTEKNQFANAARVGSGQQVQELCYYG